MNIYPQTNINNMKLTKLFLLILTISLFSITTQGQLSSDLVKENNNEKEDTIKPIESSSKLYFIATQSLPLDKKGTLYLNDNFVEGIVYDYDNEPLATSVRYRFADDEMQIFHLGQEKSVYPQKVHKIIFKNKGGDQIFIPAEYIEDNVKVFGYFELMSDGKTKILKAYRKGKNDKINTFFYVMKDDSLAYKLKTKKSSVIKFLEDKKDPITRYIAKNNINVKDMKDLEKLLNYYDSLKK